MIHTPSQPRYIQIRESLQEQIRIGHLQPGEKLPSEDQLAADFGVSRMTMRKSLSDLVEAGLIYRRHGLGTFVSNSMVQRDHTHLSDFFANCRRDGRVPHARLLCQEIVAGAPHITQALALPPKEPLLRLATLPSVDDIPITYHDAYLPVRYFNGLASEPAEKLGLDQQHVWQLIEQRGYTVANVVERLEAQIAEPVLADLLHVTTGSPILYGERVLYSDDGTRLKYADCFNRGDLFSLTVVLAR